MKTLKRAAAVEAERADRVDRADRLPELLQVFGRDDNRRVRIALLLRFCEIEC